MTRRAQAKQLPLAVRLAELFNGDRGLPYRTWSEQFPIYSWASTDIAGWHLWWPPIETLWHRFGSHEEIPPGASQDDLDAVAFMRRLHDEFRAATA